MGDNYTSNDDMGLQLPGYQASDIDSVRRGSNGPGGVVRFSTEDWDGRAATASSAADLLQEAFGNLGTVLFNNYFGICVEGDAMHAKVKTLVDQWGRSLVRQRADLQALASNCRHAGERLEKTDVDSSQGIST